MVHKDGTSKNRMSSPIWKRGGGGNRKNKIWVHTVFSRKVCKINENKPSQDHIGLYSMVQSVQLKSGLSDKQNLALDECC